MVTDGINVLSLFDGMSCGQQALERVGIKINKYYASEIDKYAIQGTQKNYPNTIQLGSVVDVDVNNLDKIDLIIGGSPCQSFSFAGKRKGMSTKCSEEIYTLEKYLQLVKEGFEFEGQSYLFWEYMRILNDIKKYNPNVYFLLENVEMGKKWERILSEAIGVFGVHINSALVSAQNRKRIYWTNIKTKKEGLFGDVYSDIPQPEDKGILLKDILESEVDEKYFLSEKFYNWLHKHSNKRGNKFKQTEGNRKAGCLSVSALKRVNLSADFIIHNTMPRTSSTDRGETSHLSRNDGKNYCLDTENTNAVEILEKKHCLHGFEHGTNGKLNKELVRGGMIRRLTPTECERLQTVKDGYTDCVSDTQRYKMLGNGWTVDVIAHIFSFLKF